MARDIIQETVLKLGAEIDNEGVQKLIRYLDMSRFKAISLTAAFTGLTTAVYKLVESATKREFELEKFAKQQNKSIALVRAENSALKAMGTTIQEINKDDRLKRIYDDVVKFNKELAFPNIATALNNVESLQTSFYKFKATLGNALQWINAQIITNLEEPIKRLDGYLSKGAKWLRDNMGLYTSKISLFITDFAKGVFGIAEGVGKVFEWITKLPDGIKAVGTAVATAFAFFKGGTIGKILTAIELVGDLMHDYDNWKYNQEHGTNIAVGLSSIWEILDDPNLSGEEKAGKIANRALNILGNSMNTAFADFDMSTIFGDGSVEGGGILGAVSKWFNDPDNKNALTNFGDGLVNFISNAVTAVGGTLGGTAATILNTIFGDIDGLNGVFEDKDGSAATAFAGGLAGYLSAVIPKIKEKGLGPGVLASGLGETLFGTIASSLISNMESKDGKITINWTNIIDDISVVGEAFLGIITEGISAVQDVGQIIFDAVAENLKTWDSSGEGKANAFTALSDAFKVLSKDKGLGDALSTGIATWFATGSVLGGIVGGLVEVIKWASEDPEKNVPELISQIEEFGNSLVNFLFGGQKEVDGKIIEYAGIIDSLGNALATIWEAIKPYLEPLWEGLSAWFNDLFKSITDSIADWFSQLWTKVWNNAPQWLKDLGILGDDPNRSTITEKDGKRILTDSHGRSREITEAEYQFLKMQAYEYTKENGKINPTGKYTVAFDEDLNMYGTGSMHFNSADDIKKAVDYYENVYIPNILGGGAGGFSLSDSPFSVYRYNQKYYALQRNGANANDIDWGAGGYVLNGETGQWQNIEGSMEGIKWYMGDTSRALRSFVGDVNGTSGELSATIYALEGDFSSLESATETLISAIEKVASSGDGKAWGGRIASEGHYTVGEDGPEYIIPITKPQRAMQLINQMMAEMGMSALSGIQNDFGIGSSASMGTFGGSIDSLLGSLGGNTNVSAPINIYVTATGADAKEIGQSAYDAAERHLVKTLRGVYA